MTDSKIPAPPKPAWKHRKQGGRKDDALKPRYELIPALPVDLIARVLTKGAEKYSDDNWRHVENGRQRYLAAAQRHLWAYQEAMQNKDDDGLYDHETGYPHMVHAMTNMMFLTVLVHGESEPVDCVFYADGGGVDD